jgi:chitin disaccharide deacetylase
MVSTGSKAFGGDSCFRRPRQARSCGETSHPDRRRSGGAEKSSQSGPGGSRARNPRIGNRRNSVHNSVLGNNNAGHNEYDLARSAIEKEFRQTWSENAVIHAMESESAEVRRACRLMISQFVSCALLLGLALSNLSTAVSAQTLADRLGYPPGTKFIIVHADDLGETHAVDAAATKALEGGTINSASLMVPCPWFPEMADYAKSHPDADFGLHLTLTAERVYYRWGPVAPSDKVPSLVDGNGYFHHDWEPNEHIIAKKINAKEVEIEIRAQIERALAMGVRITHLDSHQYRLIMSGKDLFDVMLRVAHDYKLPVFVNRDWFAAYPYLQTSLGPNDIVLDHTVTIEPEVPPEQWVEFLYDGAQESETRGNGVRYSPWLR